METYAAVREYLYSLKHRGALYGIDRMKRFVEALNFPEKSYPIIHVAGTNGKGSCCAMLEAVFREAGLVTGLFTSPHLVHQGERVQVNREILSRESIADFARRLRPIAEKLGAENEDLHPTFFEFMTGMAFLRFAERKVDIAMIETGLGGRLDATNVVDPELCIISSISLDHTEILGETAEAIAREKAGILKPGKPVVIGLLPEAAEQVIREMAKALDCPVSSVREVYGENLDTFPESALPGDYQRINAATVSLALKVLGKRFGITQAHIEKGLSSVNWSGRWERHELVDRSLILDTTHNPEGVLHLERNLQKLIRETGEKPVILVGTLGQKRAEALIPMVCRYARTVHLLVPRQPRSCSHEELVNCVPLDFENPVLFSSVQQLFPVPGICHAGEQGEVLVATGSIYLIGEIMEALYHETPFGEDQLQD
jgi:dihydrofolate synthase/folylpolyglutamate synthase